MKLVNLYNYQLENIGETDTIDFIKSYAKEEGGELEEKVNALISIFNSANVFCIKDKKNSDLCFEIIQFAIEKFVDLLTDYDINPSNDIFVNFIADNIYDYIDFLEEDN